MGGLQKMGKVVGLGIERLQAVISPGADVAPQGGAAQATLLGLGLDGLTEALGGQLGVGAQGAQLLDVRRGQGGDQVLLHGLDLVDVDVEADGGGHSTNSIVSLKMPNDDCSSGKLSLSSFTNCLASASDVIQ